MLAVLAVIYWVLRSTSFGRNVYAVGGDFEVAKYSGINVRADQGGDVPHLRADRGLRRRDAGIAAQLGELDRR